MQIKKTGSARHQTDPIVHTAVRPFANPEYYFHEAGLFRYNTFPEKGKGVEYLILRKFNTNHLFYPC